MEYKFYNVGWSERAYKEDLPIYPQIKTDFQKLFDTDMEFALGFSKEFSGDNLEIEITKNSRNWPFFISGQPLFYMCHSSITSKLNELFGEYVRFSKIQNEDYELMNLKTYDVEIENTCQGSLSYQILYLL